MATVESGSATLYYEVHGEGPPVVFAHGRGGNATIWWQQTAYFARKYRVIVYDHRTFGRSTGSAEDISLGQYAADLVAVLDAAGVERAAVVTQSMGGRSGMGAAVNFPERVACLVCTANFGGLTSPELEGVIANTPAAPAGPQRYVAKDFPERNAGLALLYAQISAFNTRIDPARLDALRDPPNRIPAERLVGFAIPTLFIAGEHDAIYPPAVIHAAAKLVPGAEVVDFTGTGHSPYWEDAPRYNALLETFLAKHWPA